MQKLLASSAAAFGFLFLFASPANAQTRTWVSGVGDDVNPCSRTAPCKTFAGAISKTAANGEINCLDPGGFGAVNITKSITIDCAGTNGHILASNTNGVTVNAAGIVVTLRNITINSASTTTGNGVRILNAAAVNIDNVTIENFAGAVGTLNGRGVAITTAAANVRVTIQNSRFYNNTNTGVDAAPTGGNVVLAILNTTFSRGSTGAVVLRSLTAGTLDHVQVTGHTGAALALQLSSASAHVSNSAFVNNGFGVFNGELGGAPTTRLFGTVITGSTTAALSINGGSVISYGNNGIRGNSGNEAPTGVATGTQ